MDEPVQRHRLADAIPAVYPCGNARADRFEGYILSCAPCHLPDGTNY